MKTTNSIRKDIVLWVEDDKALADALFQDMESIVAEYDSSLDLRVNLRNAEEFIQNNRERIALVILDLDIPESDVSIGQHSASPSPVGLRLLESYGGIPFIIFSAHPELVPTKYESQLTPLAWLEKNAKEDHLSLFVRHILAWQEDAPDVTSLVHPPLNRERKTLLCQQFRLQDIGSHPDGWNTPWDYLPLRFADELIRKTAAEFGGKLVGWSGTSALTLFPGEQNDPDHLRTALQYLAAFWRRTCGPRSNRYIWNQWFVPVFRAGLIPNFVDPVTKTGDAAYLSVTGRSGDIVRAIASSVLWGEMALPPTLLQKGSLGEAAWNFVKGKGRGFTSPLPYIGETKLAAKRIP